MTVLRVVLFVTFSLFPALAMANAQTDALLRALGMERMIELMRLEGLDYAVELGDEMLPGGYTEAFGASVARIYDLDAMRASVQAGFAQTLEGVDLAPLEVFFASQAGQRIVALELSAREAMMDEAIEEAAEDSARRFERAGDDIFHAVDAFVQAGDLLEANVVGALNTNMQFYRGLVDGGAFELSEEQILSDVWAQEEDTRADTRDWLYGFLIMAYQPLPPGELEAYTDLSRTPEGRALTAALFEGFDSMYAGISYGLGLAVAQAMKSEDI